jgi:hypothetical protein
MTAKSKTKVVELEMDDVESLLAEAKASLSEKNYELVKALIESYRYVTGLVEDKKTTIGRLRKILFGSKTEKTKDILGDQPQESPSAGATEEKQAPESPEVSTNAETTTPKKGH